LFIKIVERVLPVGEKVFGYVFAFDDFIRAMCDFTSFPIYFHDFGILFSFILSFITFIKDFKKLRITIM
jgi:hypothetical protein